MRWFDLMGLQRHIKVLGIFARLFYRDGKPGYLRICRACWTTAATPPRLSGDRGFRAISCRRVEPAFEAAQARRALAGRRDRRGAADGRTCERPGRHDSGRGARRAHAAADRHGAEAAARGARQAADRASPERLASAGISQVVVNLAWLGAMIRDRLGDGARFGVPIVYSDESPQALETGAAFFARCRCSGPALSVLNADVFTDFPSWRCARGAATRTSCSCRTRRSTPSGDFGLEHGLAAERRRAVHFLRHRRLPAAFFAGCGTASFP